MSPARDNGRSGRIGRAILLGVCAFVVCLLWAGFRWLEIPHHEPQMLGWLLSAPLVASFLLVGLLVGLPTLTPPRPLTGLFAACVPLLHGALLVALSAALTQRPSPIIDLTEPQRYVAVWSRWDLVLPILGLEAAVIGLVAMIDQALANRR